MTQTSQELEFMLTKLSKQESEIAFDGSLHRYIVDGVEYPSVTQVLFDVGLVDTTWFKKGSDERGNRIHWICEQSDKDPDPLRVFIDDVLEEYEGYLDAWEDFKRKSGFVVSAIETKVYAKNMGMAGTIDRIGLLNDKLTILDIKSGAKQKWHGVQLAGYKMIFQHLLPQSVELRGVYIKKTGKWTMQDYTADEYVSIMMASLTLYRWKRKSV